MERTEGLWTKWGVVIAAVTLIITYSGTASQLHWPPFSQSGDQNSVSPPPPPSSSPSPSSPSPSPPSPSWPSSPPYSPSSPSLSSPLLSEGATFVSAIPWGSTGCQCSYQYRVRIHFTGLEGVSCALRWWTVYDPSRLGAGTNGYVFTNLLPYNNDTWTDTLAVTVPPGALEYGSRWHPVFAVYAPGGVELAEDP
jgi:hypothetical protein